MSRGRCYPDVGAWSGSRKNAGRIVGVREIRVEEEKRVRHRGLDKPEVYAGIVHRRAHSFFFSVVILFFFFPSSPLGRSLGQKKTRRTKRNGKLCRLRVGSDNFWDSRIASTRQGEEGEGFDNASGYKTEM